MKTKLSSNWDRQNRPPTPIITDTEGGPLLLGLIMAYFGLILIALALWHAIWTKAQAFIHSAVGLIHRAGQCVRMEPIHDSATPNGLLTDTYLSVEEAIRRQRKFGRIALSLGVAPSFAHVRPTLATESKVRPVNANVGAANTDQRLNFN
jgi:hypothetical protein